MKAPSISVIIPTFNVQDSIKACLESIVYQQGVDFEIIICDGLSTDKTLEIISEYEQYPLKVSSRKDSGVYDAMNNGVRMASGNWLYFLGANDQVASNLTFASLLQSAGQSKLVIANIQNTDRPHMLVPAIHKGSFDWKIWFSNRVHHQGALYHSSLFESLEFNTNRKVLGDYEFNLKLYQQKTPWVYLNETIAICEASGLSKQFKKSLYDEELEIKRELLSVPAYWIQVIWTRIKYWIKG